MSLRKFARLAGAVAALFPFATCTDFTGPSGRGVRVPVAPTFSPAATFAKALYSSAGIEFDRVRVLIVRGESEVLKDTTVAFSPTTPELTLPLVVSAAPGEVVKVTLEYRNPDVVLYAGTATVTTQPIAVTSASTTPIILVPVGPGATTETVQLSPNSGSFPTTAAVTFTAQAFATGGAPISNAIFGWSVDDATVATVNAQGVLQPTTKGGTVHVRATTLNAKFAEAAVTFFTTPASLAVQSGGNQTAMSFEPLPANVVVKVLDVNGNGVPGATVNFAVTTGGGTITALNEISDPAGLASVKWTLGDVVGAQSVTATATALPNAPLTINATGTERPAVTLAFLQQPTKSLMGAAIMPAITVKALDDKGRVVTGFVFPIAITFDANPTSATLAGSASKNAVAGVATFTDLSVNKAGTGYTLKATANGLTQTISSSFDVDQVPSGLSLFAGGSQTAAIRSTLSQVAVKVADANGIGVPGITVAFAVVSGNGSIVVDNGVTDAQGLAKVTWKLGDDVGAQSISATSIGLAGSPLTITATATPLPAIALLFVQQPGNVGLNASVSPAVTVKAIDADGKIVAGFAGNVTVTLQTNPGSATLAGTTIIAAVGGIATFSNLSLDVPGSGYKLGAASGALAVATSNTFVVSPPSLAFHVQPSNVDAGAVITPAVQVNIVDANGATLTAATNPVTLSFDSSPTGATLGGTLTVTPVNGVATFSNLTVSLSGAGYTLKAASSGLTTGISSSFTGSVPPARAWTGSVSTQWQNANNWSPAVVPGASDSVSIGTPANQPVIDAGATARVIAIATGGSLRIKSTTGVVSVPKIINRGTLWLDTAIVAGSIENRGTLVADGFASADSVAGFAGAMTRIIGTGSGDAALAARVFVNDGTLEMTDNSEGSASLVLTDSLVNRAGATVNVLLGAGGVRVISGVLRNYGALNVPSNRGLTLSLTKTGSVNAGSIDFSGGGPFTQVFSDSTFTFTNASTGTIALGPSAWDLFSGHLTIKAGTITGSGLFSTTQSQLDIDFAKLPMRLQIDAFTLFAGDSIVIPAAVSSQFEHSTLSPKVVVLGTLTTYPSEGGPVDFASNVSVKSGGILESQGDANVHGTLSIATGATLRVVAREQDRTFSVASSFTNYGLIELTSADAYLSNLAVDGMLTNAPSGVIKPLKGSSILSAERRITGKFTNQGTVTIAGDTYLTLMSGSTGNVNSGTITLSNPGILTEVDTDANTHSFEVLSDGSATTFTNNGTISIGSHRAMYVGGDATVVNGTAGVIGGIGKLRVPEGGTFTNIGTLAPGGVGTIGTLTYEGEWNAGSGTLAIDVADSVSNYDVLRVTGQAILGGTLSVQVLSPFTPIVGMGTWIVVTSDASWCSSDFEVVSSEWGYYNDGCAHMYYQGPLFQPPAAKSAKRPPEPLVNQSQSDRRELPDTPSESTPERRDRSARSGPDRRW